MVSSRDGNGDSFSQDGNGIVYPQIYVARWLNKIKSTVDGEITEPNFIKFKTGIEAAMGRELLP